MNPRAVTIEGQHILYDADVLSEVEPGLFDPHQLRQRGLLTGSAPGRGTTWFFAHDDLALVLRHYRRGGAIAKVISDHYLWTGIQRTRAWREFALLAHLHAGGLPVPQPVAARVIRNELMYRADLVTRRLLFTEPLAEKLKTSGLDAARWRGIGLCIRRFHDAGAYHADLNAHNILLGRDNTVFLADFDKGELRTRDGGWKQDNLARLRRSLDKLRHQYPGYGFSAGDWQLLVDAYEST